MIKGEKFSPPSHPQRQFFPSPVLTVGSSDEPYLLSRRTLKKSNSANLKKTTSSSFYFKRNKNNCAALVNKISDYFDGSQINTALTQANNYQERLKVVDYVLKQRTQIKENEEKVKLERIVPLIKNFRESVQSKKKEAFFCRKSNKFRETIRLLVDNDGANPFPVFDAPLSVDRLRSQNDLTTDRLLTTEPTSERARVDDPLSARYASIGILSPEKKEGSISRELEKRRFSEKPQTERGIHDFLGENLTQGELNSERETRPSILDCRKKSVIAQNLSKAHIVEKFKGLFKKKEEPIDKDILLKVQKPTPRKKVVLKSIKDEANKMLESDLYNYLVKYGQSNNSLIQSARSEKVGTPSKIKAIESRALTNFENLQSKHRNFVIPAKPFRPLYVK